MDFTTHYQSPLSGSIFSANRRQPLANSFFTAFLKLKNILATLILAVVRM